MLSNFRHEGFMRPILVMVVGIFVAGIVIGASLVSTPVEKTTPEEEIQIKTAEESAVDENETQNNESGIKTYLVTRAIDGDTIEIEGGQRIRYIGIDTPETVDPRKPVQCFGVEASNKNKELVEGKKVRLEKDVSETDKYGRLVRYVYVDGLLVNLELVRLGYAYSYTYPPDVTYQDKIVEAQREARENNRGLWGACTADVSPPSLAPTPQTASDPPSTDCTIKGNISGSGEKIYHVDGCDSYNATKIDEARGELWFCTEKEALEAGWRKALNC